MNFDVDGAPCWKGTTPAAEDAAVGINWPHHVFVDQAFQIIGAN